MKKGGKAQGRGSSRLRFPLESRCRGDGLVSRGTRSNKVPGQPSYWRVGVVARVSKDVVVASNGSRGSIRDSPGQLEMLL